MDSIITNAINRIIELAKPVHTTIDGKIYHDNKFTPALTRYPDCLTVNTLDGIVDFIHQNPESWEGFFLHVVDYDQVHLFKAMHGDFNQRHLIMAAGARSNKFEFGKRYSLEEFAIAMRCLFVESNDRQYILEFISKIKIDAFSTVEDNGVSQTLTAKQAGTSLSKPEVIKPIVKLKPFRTFAEVDQPESEFVFRMVICDGAPYFILKECDGGAWKVDAIDKISQYLINGLKEFDLTVPIIA